MSPGIKKRVCRNHQGKKALEAHLTDLGNFGIGEALSWRGWELRHSLRVRSPLSFYFNDLHNIQNVWGGSQGFID